MKKILVVYYSRTGMTKKLANSIANLLFADIEEIVDTKNRSGLMWYLGAGRDAALKRETIIEKSIYDPSTYDIVCIWTPVRDFAMSSAIRTYLKRHEEKFPASLIFFCTQARSWAEITFHEMGNAIAKTPIMTITYTSKDIQRDTYQESLKQQLIAFWLFSNENDGL
jgi:flavodoxin